MPIDKILVHADLGRIVVAQLDRHRTFRGLPEERRVEFCDVRVKRSV